MISEQILKLSRRDFLEGSIKVSGTLLLPPLIFERSAYPAPSSFAQSVPSFADFRFVPRYPSTSPLQEILKALRPGEDDFPDEGIVAEVERVLTEWGDGLQQSPPTLRAVRSSLSTHFAGASLISIESRALRSDSVLQIFHELFSEDASLRVDEFSRQLSGFVASESSVLSVEFKVPSVSIVTRTPLVITTSVRYSLVETGPRFHRQERIGQWRIDWEKALDGKMEVTKWRAIEETRTRASKPIFVDITANSMRSVPSYADQVKLGTDYWRTVLDGACGIDVYGNNGIAVGDIDNDGFDEIYICQPAGLPNRLYRNRGDGTFEDITEEAGVGVLDDTACALFVDVDNSGHQDLVVVRAAGPLLFQNDGRGRFILKSNAFQFAQAPQGTFTGASFADYDRDGWLDVYFCLYSYYQGVDQYRYPTPYFDAENGPPNFLLRNNRDGTFSDVTTSSGLQQNNNRFSFDCTWCDFDGDGWPDLYVVNDFGKKNLYHNKRDGTFSDIAEEAGVVDVGPGMSSCWIDYDNDGNFDLYVSDMWEAAGMRISKYDTFMPGAPEHIRALFRHHAKGNSLFRNQGKAKFEDWSETAGVEDAGWSWSCDTWDFDHDGHPDIYIANGMISGASKDDLEGFFWRQTVSRSPLGANPSQRYEQGWNAINELIRSDGTWNGYQRNVFFANNRDGTFSQVSGAIGLDFIDDSRTFALTDLDHDGRLELVLKNRTGPQIRILKNEFQELGDSICFRLTGTKSNRDAIGTRINLESESGYQAKFLQAGSGFLSEHTKEVFFGLAKQTGTTVKARIHWPSGIVEQFDGLPVNHRIHVIEGEKRFETVPFHALIPHAELLDQEPLPIPVAADTWLIEPIAAADFSMEDPSGRLYTLDSFRGHFLLLNFWSKESRLSRTLLDSFCRGFSKLSQSNVAIAAVNVDGANSRDIIRTLIQEVGITFPVLLASDEMLGVYNLIFRFMFDRRRDLGIPTTFLVDPHSYIVRVFQGLIDIKRLSVEYAPSTSAERMHKGLPFPGTYYGGEMHRNNFTLGVAFSQNGYVEQAIRSFQLVLNQYPDYAEAHYNLGTLYLKRHLIADARAHLLEAVRLAPVHPNALNNLGLLALEENHEEEAIRFFQQAIKQSPEYITALQNLGNLYRHEGQFDAAKHTLEAAIHADPEDAELTFSLAMVYAQSDDLKAAEPLFERSVRLKPDYAPALNNLGVLYRRMGDPTRAAEVFERCIRVAPSFDQPYLNLAELYLASGESQKAVVILQTLLQFHPSHPEAQRLLRSLGR
jgi:tetratricopeptide (TPR) repeat protein/peroxiredoxin